jgi:hypothetical protein
MSLANISSLVVITVLGLIASSLVNLTITPHTQGTVDFVFPGVDPVSHDLSLILTATTEIDFAFIVGATDITTLTIAPSADVDFTYVILDVDSLLNHVFLPVTYEPVDLATLIADLVAEPTAVAATTSVTVTDYVATGNDIVVIIPDTPAALTFALSYDAVPSTTDEDFVSDFIVPILEFFGVDAAIVLDYLGYIIIGFMLCLLMPLGLLLSVPCCLLCCLCRCSRDQEGPKSVGLAYFFWVIPVLGHLGLHRYYLGKWCSGILYTLTFGFLGIGWWLDLCFLPGTVDRRNKKIMKKRRPTVAPMTAIGQPAFYSAAAPQPMYYMAMPAQQYQYRP